MVNEPKLKHYIARYKFDKKFLENHPEHKELLEKRLERHKKDIVDYVTSKNFECVLNHMNL